MDSSLAEQPESTNFDVEEVAPKSELMSLELAESLLDYRQYERVAAAMRARVQEDAKDAKAWRLLEKALKHMGQEKSAQHVQRKLDDLGEKKSTWHVSLKMAALVDSNVVIAPSAVNLTASDKGDIGASVSLALSGELFAYEHGFTQVWFRYNDMLYQDFNRFALRTIQAGVAQHLTSEGKSDIWLGAESDYATLGGKGLFSGFSILGGASLPFDDAWQLEFKGLWGHRNFSNSFADFSAWRWRASTGVKVNHDDWTAQLRLLGGYERTQLVEEAYREMAIRAEASHKLFTLMDDDTWLSLEGYVLRRDYQNIDGRAFLKAPLLRRDNAWLAKVTWEWRRAEALWGAKLSEKWYMLGGMEQNNSNMNVTQVISAAQSRAWKRWWTELGVQWMY